MKKLTNAQALALRVLRAAEGWRNQDKLRQAAPGRLSLSTLEGLEKLEMVKSKHSENAKLYPHYAISWRITPKGYSAIVRHDFRL